MTITKTMKSKLVLGILAAAVSLSLAIGGTLMLFTADSETATNVVTLGSASIELQEFDKASNGYKAIDKTEFTGIEFLNVVPGATLEKRPQVKNNGSVPVYVYVEGTLTVDGDDVDLSSIEFDNAGNIVGGTEVAQQVYAILDSVNATALTSSWKGTPIDDTQAEDGILTGIWYYSDTVGELDILPVGGTTGDIFTKVVIPFEDVDNALAGYTISLALTAYAVQSDNNNATALELTDDVSFDVDYIKDQFAGANS
jgi:predicted ribosomally synthesized peptide with SipW-like signal peptide